MATGWLGVTLIANDYRWAEGMQMIERSLAQNPGDAELLSVYALHLNFMQLEGEGRALSRALRLDPYGTVPIAGRLNILLSEGRFLDALALLESIPPHERDGYFFNYQAAVVNLMIGRLNAADDYIQKARRTAHPDDLSLDALEWGIDSLRGNRRAPPFSKQLERMRTERSSFFVNRGLILEWEDSASMVAAFDLAIEQRLPEMRRILLGRKPPLMPEAEWSRMQDIAGVKWTSLGPVIPRT